MNDKTGGPAFLLKGPVMTCDERGMTLRDWFAGMAMQGLLSCNIDCDPQQVPTIAKACYAMADVMIKARTVTEG